MSVKAVRKAACCARCIAPWSFELAGSYLVRIRVRLRLRVIIGVAPCSFGAGRVVPEGLDAPRQLVLVVVGVHHNLVAVRLRLRLGVRLGVRLRLRLGLRLRLRLRLGLRLGLRLRLRLGLRLRLRVR